jgi:DNA-binding winged helix-turn-helix (wHTH) protein/Tol biopolymer transport system component
MHVVGEDKRVLRFGLFEADLRAGELRRNGSKVRLQEQPFQVLTVLLEHSGELVTRDELRNRLWASDTFVDFDHSLNTAVRRLRDALGDSAESPRYVETVARRGYRFLAPVTGNGMELSPLPVVDAPRPSSRSWLLAFFAGAIAVALVAVLTWHMLHWTPRPPLSQKRLTAKPEDDPILSAVISPDGKYLAFADHTGFYLQQVDTGETHAVPLPRIPQLRDASFRAIENHGLRRVGEDTAIPILVPEPASWFPDSTHLIATWVTDSEEPPSLWEISVLGGEPRRLIDGGWRPSVSPDGEQVAFQRNSSKGENEIWVIRSDSLQAHMVRPPDGSYFGTPAWSPDGRVLVFPRSLYTPGMGESTTEIDTLDLTAGKSQTVFTRQGLGPAVAWLPDNRVVFSLQEAPPNQGDSNLWAFRMDPKTSRRVSEPTRITSQAGGVANLNVSADGKRLAMTRRVLQPDVYVADVLNHGGALGPLKRLTLDERSDVPYAWTPDSRSVLFISDRYGTNNIFKQGVDEPTPDLLVGGKEDLQGPRLSADLTQIIYLVRPHLDAASHLVRLMRVPLSGGAPQLILEAPGITNQQCARAPSNVCLFSQMISRTEMRVFYFDPYTGKGAEIEKARVTGDDAYIYNWTLSSDGRTLAMSKKIGLEHEPAVRLLSLVDGSERILRIPGWPGIACLDFAGDGKSIWVVMFTTSEAKTLINLDLQGRIRPVLREEKMVLGWAIPSPDGRKVALWKASGGSNVWLVENF